MADAGARRHDLQIVERGRAPFEEFVAFGIACIFDGDIGIERICRAGLICHDAMIDYQVDRYLRIDPRRIGAPPVHGVAHGGQIDNARNPGEVLHQHAGRTVLDLARGAIVLLPFDEGADVIHRDRSAVLEAQEVFQQHLEAEGQAADVAQSLSCAGEAVISVILRLDGQGGAGAQGVAAYGGHGDGPVIS